MGVQLEKRFPINSGVGLTNVVGTATIKAEKSTDGLDDIVYVSIVDDDLTAPPASPTKGSKYIPAATATGAWAGKEGQIAIFEGLWVFLAPLIGMKAFIEDEDIYKEYDGAAWVNERLPLLGVESKAANYTILTPNDNGKLFISTAAITITLPATSVGQHYFFSVGSANDLTIGVPAGDTMSLPATGIPGSDAKGIVAGAIGESIHLACAATGNWIALGGQTPTGIWVAEA